MSATVSSVGRDILVQDRLLRYEHPRAVGDHRQGRDEEDHGPGPEGAGEARETVAGHVVKVTYTQSLAIKLEKARSKQRIAGR